MSLKGKSLSVLTPMYAGLCTCNYFESFLRLIITLAQNGIPFSHTYTWNESLITRARNRLADEFMKNHQSTHAVFIDADIGFEANDILALMEHDLEIIGAPCSKKSIKWDRVTSLISRNGQTYSDEQLTHVSGDFVFNFDGFKGTKQIKVNELQDVRHVGTGLMMVRRDVFERYQEHYPDRWYESRGDPNSIPGPTTDYFRTGINPETHEYDSEDYSFCTDCRAFGVKTWMAPFVRTTHVGNYKFVADMPAVAAAGLSI